MLAIEDNVPIPAAHPADKNRVTASLQNLIDRYSEAYKLIYGIKPTVIWQNPWFKITGSESRVSRARLLELTRRLEYRAG